MVEIVDYRPGWRTEYRGIAEFLGTGLGDMAIRIEHIGSTAVPGLCAKDVIDVQVSVAKLDIAVADRVGGLGFVHCPDVRGDHVPPGYSGSDEDWAKLLFVEPASRRRANVHVRQSGQPNERYALLFRDYLIAHPMVAAAYGELKRRLAAGLADADTYSDVKDPAVDLIYLAAEEWAADGTWTGPGRERRDGTRTESHSAPDGWHTVTPRIVVRGVERLVGFLAHVFGATGEYRRDMPSLIRIGDSTVMVSEAGPRNPAPAFLYVYVDDADETHRRAVLAGATSLEPPADMPYGDRRGMVADEWGNTWQIATHRRSHSP
jgi:GrpB-like predicted nucleotidyltransferase (UPF0157 family)/uncharacterized glyoxalase superfamily protein PhnB